MSGDQSTGMGVVPPLPRPEYVSSPEVYHSALAWSLVPEEHRGKLLSPRTPSGSASAKVIGVVYKDETPPAKEPRNVALVRTYPAQERVGPWRQSLKQNGLASKSEGLGQAVADAMLAVAPERALSRLAVPLTRHSALLQNPHGALRKSGPPPLAKILETIFAMGGGDREGVAVRWRRAMEVRQESSPLLESMDRSVKSVLILPMFEASVGLEPDLMAPRAGLSDLEHAEAKRWANLLGEDTPFAWFREAWTLLTSPDWAGQLPPRMWVDWASTVIRTAVASAYLWEATWFEKLAMVALDHPDGGYPTFPEVRAQVDELVPWRRSTEAPGIRDVVSPLRRRVFRGAAVRGFLMQAGGVADLGSFFETAHRADDFRKSLRDALGSQKKTLVWEAVRYGLSTRDTIEGSADFYGLLRNSGRRYAVVAPGTEWTALMVALACGRPGGEATVSSLRRQLQQLGLRPELPELVALLERAGLASGNADADEAVLIRSPF